MPSQSDTCVTVNVRAVLSSQPSGDGGKSYTMHIDSPIGGHWPTVRSFRIQKPVASQDGVFTVIVNAADYAPLGPVSLQRSKIRFQSASEEDDWKEAVLHEFRGAIGDDSTADLYEDATVTETEAEGFFDSFINADDPSTLRFDGIATFKPVTN